MTAERTERGLEARLRPQGVGRFFSAAFLLVWLTGWLFGECFALWILIRGAVALVTGHPPAPGRDPIALAPALAVGGFLLVWLTFWTLGGVLAIAELLRSLWAEDRLTAGAGALAIERRLGPFRSRRVIPQGDLRDIRLMARTGGMVAETTKARIELSRLGTSSEREQLTSLFRRELRLDERSPAALHAELPEGWQDVITPEGTRVLVQDPAVQATQARVAAILAFVFSSATVLLIREAIARPSLLPFTILLGAISLAATWGAVWLARGRMEWRIEGGRLVHQRRFGAKLRELFTATRLELTASRDSDSDEWFELAALAGPGESAPVNASAAIRRGTGDRKLRRRIYRAMHDDATARRLGVWLSQRAGMPFEDRATKEARALEIAQLRAQLAASGKFGVFAARLIDRVERRRAR